MNGAANRRRGHSAERAVVQFLRAHGYPDAVTTRNTGGAGGRQDGDISFDPLVVLETKDVAASSWPSWLRQAELAAGEDRIAAVVRRVRGQPDVGYWDCRWTNPFLRAGVEAAPFRFFVSWVRHYDDGDSAA